MKFRNRRRPCKQKCAESDTDGTADAGQFNTHSGMHATQFFQNGKPQKRRKKEEFLDILSNTEQEELKVCCTVYMVGQISHFNFTELTTVVEKEAKVYKQAQSFMEQTICWQERASAAQASSCIRATGAVSSTTLKKYCEYRIFISCTMSFVMQLIIELNHIIGKEVAVSAEEWELWETRVMKYATLKYGKKEVDKLAELIEMAEDKEGKYFVK